MPALSRERLRVDKLQHNARVEIVVIRLGDAPARDRVYTEKTIFSFTLNGICSPWANRFRGVIRPESSPHVFLLPKTLNLKKKSGAHLSVVAFGSERHLSENIYTF